MNSDNQYMDLTTYNEIYQELVYQRNAVIAWLKEHALLERNRQVGKDDNKELLRHSIAGNYRSLFDRTVEDLLDRLYSHDAIEALYDFKSIELGEWSDTEANRLERELQQLQVIIGKLETRYQLHYQFLFEYDSAKGVLLMNGAEVFACGLTTLRNRLLTTLFSKPQALWKNDDIEDYFVEHFDYVTGDLSDSNISKTARDIRTDVASKVAVKNFLIIDSSSVRINPAFIT